MTTQGINDLLNLKDYYNFHTGLDYDNHISNDNIKKWVNDLYKSFIDSEQYNNRDFFCSAISSGDTKVWFIARYDDDCECYEISCDIAVGYHSSTAYLNPNDYNKNRYFDKLKVNENE